MDRRGGGVGERRGYTVAIVMPCADVVTCAHAQPQGDAVVPRSSVRCSVLAVCDPLGSE